MNQESNFNIADLYNALQEFARIVNQLHEKADNNEINRQRLRIAMVITKKVIEELFGQLGEPGTGNTT